MNEIQNIDTLTTEILILKNQTAQNIMEIGKRLISVKESLPHGSFGEYLKEKVAFSERTAQNFMKVAREFSNTQALADLEPTKVYALLDLPLEDRENFLKENDVERMSTRELQKAIKDKQLLEEELAGVKDVATKAINEKLKIESRLRTADEALRDTQRQYKGLEVALAKEKESLKKEKENSKDEIAKLQSFIGEAQSTGNDEEVARLQASLKEIQSDLDTSALKIDELEEQLKAKPLEVITASPEIIEKVPEEIKRELEELRQKANQNNGQAVIKFKVYFGELQNIFREELSVMAEIKETDPVTYEKCKSNISKLINSMSEHL